MTRGLRFLILGASLFATSAYGNSCLKKKPGVWTPPQAECVRKCQQGDVRTNYGYRKAASSCAAGFRKIAQSDLCILKRGYCKLPVSVCKRECNNP